MWSISIIVYPKLYFSRHYYLDWCQILHFFFKKNEVCGTCAIVFHFLPNIFIILKESRFEQAADVTTEI